MPNTREKLIELLRSTRHEYRRYIAMKDYEKRIAKTDEEFLAVDDSIVGEIPFCADHLIANGVTVQQWIPVSEPPKENGYYLCVVCVSAVNHRKEYRRMILFWEDNVWIDMSNCFRTRKPLYWTHLPELPKEDNYEVQI